jgi:hypothetical protein
MNRFIEITNQFINGEWKALSVPLAHSISRYSYR